MALGPGPGAPAHFAKVLLAALAVTDLGSRYGFARPGS